MTGSTDCDLRFSRVLIVEDEFLLADDMALVLEKCGAHVVGPVASPHQALDLLAEEPVDAAVLDINLNGQTVFPVADALRQEGVPFVFTTGYDAASIPDAYKDVPRWEKPFEPQDLAKALPSIIQRA